MKTLPTELYEAMNVCHEFMPATEYRMMRGFLKGKEAGHFADKFIELAKRISDMPKTYEQDGKGDEAIVYLHYFRGNQDWWIYEKDAETQDRLGQHQAFGLADLGYGGELGYISIVELVAAGVELDLYFRPTPLAEIKAKRTARQEAAYGQ